MQCSTRLQPAQSRCPCRTPTRSARGGSAAKCHWTAPHHAPVSVVEVRMQDGSLGRAPKTPSFRTPGGGRARPSPLGATASPLRRPPAVRDQARANFEAAGPSRSWSTWGWQAWGPRSTGCRCPVENPQAVRHEPRKRGSAHPQHDARHHQRNQRSPTTPPSVTGCHAWAIWHGSLVGLSGRGELGWLRLSERSSVDIAPTQWVNVHG